MWPRSCGSGTRTASCAVALRLLGARADGAGVSGSFVIRAGSREEALALARTHPPLRYGGAIALREVDPV